MARSILFGFLLSFLFILLTQTDLLADSAISAVWINSGEDKVTQDELRASTGSAQGVTNAIWDGSTVSLHGAKNEVVSFNIILESAYGIASNVSVVFNELSGPSGSLISSESASGDEVFDYVNRSIELFYIRYLQIKGLSLISYDTYDERHIPERLRRPYNEDGEGTGTWQDRPDHDKYYPEIALPLEIKGQFDIENGQNQSIWVDVYIPKTAASGTYAGTIQILQNNVTAFNIPVSLNVFAFTLPDAPNSKTMLYLGDEDINKRYLGHASPANPAESSTERLVRDRHFQMAHRHKISLIDSNPGSSGTDQPHSQWIPRLDGSLFTETNDYDGPGKSQGNGVFSIGTYGDWSWSGEGELSMRTHSDAWVNWFEQNSSETEYFLYLIDESSNYTQINTWANWLNNNPGSGSRLMSLATLDLTSAVNQTPELDIGVGWFMIGVNNTWQSAADSLNNQTGKMPFMYNGFRPGSGTFATEDDGVSLRELSWGQYKKNISRWYFWESTYYNNYQGSAGETNVFEQAQTFGEFSSTSETLGETGWNYSNGDGVLFYPGTDLVFPSESYGLDGPIASLRLKHWRRGIQDVDYLTLAAVINPQQVTTIVNEMVPTALWEYGVTDPNDPTWVSTDISWSIDPDDWESARRRLAGIILTPLGPSLCSEWNGFLGGMWNIAEHMNLSSGPLTLQSLLYNIDGTVMDAKSFTLPVGVQYDLLVHDMAGWLHNSYGKVCTIAVGGNPGDFNGRMVYYKEAVDSTPPNYSFQFAFAMPFLNGITGTQSVPFNTFQPSLDPADALDRVANWIQLTNLETSSQSGTLYFYGLDGTQLGSETATLAEGARNDYSAHQFGSNLVGIVQWVPNNQSTSFQLRNVRYLYDNALWVDSFDSAFQIEGAVGSGALLAVPLNTSSGSAIIEVANTTSSEITVVVKIYDLSGNLLDTQNHTLNRYASVHIITDQILDSAQGIATIQGSASNSIIATAMQYGRNGSLGTEYLFGIPGKQALGTTLRGSYNSFLGQGCRLLLTNPTGNSETVDISMVRYDGTIVLAGTDITVPAQGLADYNLCANDPSDSYGVVTVQTSTANSIVAWVIRVGANNGYRFPTSVG